MDIAWIRGQIPGLKHGVYLNTAGIGLSPVSVNKAVAEGYQQLRSGSVSTSDWYAAMSRGRGRIAGQNRRLRRSRCRGNRVDDEHRRGLRHGTRRAAVATGRRGPHNQ